MVQGKGIKIISNIVLFIFALCAVLPIILLLIGSLTDNATALSEGFSYFPSKWSTTAYEYIVQAWATVGRGYINTILVTVVGTAVSLLVTSMFGYGITVEGLPGKKLLIGLLVLTMLFNGGIVAQYMVYNRLLHIRDTIFALIVPNYLMSTFNVILVSNFFRNNVPAGILEAARIDGASEFRVFWKILLPLSKPILATIGIMTAIGYWNDWMNGLYYLTSRNGGKFYTIQLILNEIANQVNFLASRAAEMGVTVDSSAVPTTTVRMAIALVGILPIIIAFPFFQKYFVKGIAVGGVKG